MNVVELRDKLEEIIDNYDDNPVAIDVQFRTLEVVGYDIDAVIFNERKLIVFLEEA